MSRRQLPLIIYRVLLSPTVCQRKISSGQKRRDSLFLFPPQSIALIVSPTVCQRTMPIVRSFQINYPCFVDSGYLHESPSRCELNTSFFFYADLARL